MTTKLGFSFGFGARDDGMGRAMSSALDSLTRINKQMGVQDRAARGSAVPGALRSIAKAAGAAAAGTARMGAGMAGAFGRAAKNRINSFNLASVAQNVRSLTADSGDLVLSMEAAGAAYAQQAKPTLAMMGATGKELRQLTGQASSMAYGLNVGVETVTKTMVTMRQASEGTRKVFDKLGMSTAEFVKLAEGTGVATEQLGSAAGLMTDQWKMGADQAKAMLEYSVAMGQKGGVGGLMFTGMAEQVTNVNNLLSYQVSSHMRTADELDRMMKSSVRMAGAYRKLGFDAEVSSKTATETAGKFLEWQIQLERFQAGEAGAELPQIIADLAALGMGTDEAFRLLKLGSEDSTAAMLELSQYMQRAAASGKNLDQATLANLQNTLGGVNTNILSLAMSGDKSINVLTEMSQATVKADGALKQLANDSYSSGRTMQEALDMAKEGFRMRMRSLTRGEVRGFVKDEIKLYKTMGKEIQQLGDDKTFGPLLKAVSVFDQMGAQGVMLHLGKQLGMDTKEMQRFGIMANLTMDTLGKVQQEFAPMFETLGMFGPAGALAGGLLAWFAIPQDVKDNLYKMFEPFIDWAKGKAFELWDRFKTAASTTLSEIDWGGMLGKLQGAMDTIVLMVAKAVMRVMPEMGKALGLDTTVKRWEAQQRAATAPQRMAAAQQERIGTVSADLRQKRLYDIAATEGQSRALTSDEESAITQAATTQVMAERQSRQVKDTRLATSTGRQQQAGLEAAAAARKSGQDIYAQRMAYKAAAEREQTRQGIDTGTAAYENAGLLGKALMFVPHQIDKVVSTLKAESLTQKIESAKQGQGVEMLGPNDAWMQQMRAAAESVRQEQAQAGAYLAGAREEVKGTLDMMQDPAMMDLGYSGGQSFLSQIGTGIAEATPELMTSMEDSLDTGVKQLLPQSPVAAGPLQDPFLPDAGANILLQIEGGLRAQLPWFQEGFAAVLEEATTFAIGRMHDRSLAELQSSGIGAEVFGSITAQYGGLLTEDDKKVLKQSLDMSGLFGVINAIVLDGAETRKVLGEIRDNTAGLRAGSPSAPTGVAQNVGAAGRK